MESYVLQQTLQRKPAVIALGGGTPFKKSNQKILIPHILVHITAPQEVIFARIVDSGIPAFFPPDENPLTAFTRLWNERVPIYQTLARYTVINDTSPQATVGEIKRVLRQ